MIKQKVNILSLVFAMLLSACQTDDVYEVVGDENSPIVVGAVASAPYKTRSSVGLVNGNHAINDKIPVQNGNMTFSYATIQDSRALPTIAICKIENGVGKIYRGSAPLQWKNIGGTTDSRATFLLDNVDERDYVPEEIEYDEDGNITYFGPDWTRLGIPTKYDAAMEQNTATQAGVGNDVLWGSVLAQYGHHTEELVNAGKDTPMPFQLSHRMSRLCVELVNLAPEQRNSHISIKLANIITHPVGFNRVSGTVMIPNDRTDATIYDEFELYNGVPGGEGTNFTTSNLILPPEEDLYRRNNRGIERPKLIISVDGRTYSAYLPQSMIYDEDINNPGEKDENEVDYSVNLNFRASHHLTLRAKLIGNTEQPIIEFMPVLVEKWDYVFHGELVAETDESASRGTFSTSEEIDNFITLYNAQPFKAGAVTREMFMTGAGYNDSYNFVARNSWDRREMLRRKWIINLPEGNNNYQLANIFKEDYYRTDFKDGEYNDFGKYPIEINFNGNTINGCKTTAELLGVGIKTAEELQECIKYYNRANLATWEKEYYLKFLKYGTYEKYRDDDKNEHYKIYIDLIANITDMPAGFTRFKMKSEAEFEFRFNGYTINGVSTVNDLME